MKPLACLLAIMLIVVAGESFGLAQQLEPMQYQIEAILDTENHTLNATQQITYPNDGDTPLSSLYFVLAANLNQEANPFLNPVIVDAGYDYGFDPSWDDD